MEEISPSAAEPDITVRAEPSKGTSASAASTILDLKSTHPPCKLDSKHLDFFVFVEQDMTENSPLGDLLRGSVDLSSCQIGK